MSAIEWLEEVTPSSIWVNKPSISRRIAPVIYQLMIAERCGFQTPATLFTNNLTDLTEFSRLYTKVVIKPGNLAGVRTNGKRILAHIVEVSDISESTLANAPCLFQEYIDKEYEIRVHVTKNNVLACKIDSQISSNTKADWRNYDIKNTPHSSISLGSTVEEQCRKLIVCLGLEFGVIDLIRTPKGEIIFLECNSKVTGFGLRN